LPVFVVLSHRVSSPIQALFEFFPLNHIHLTLNALVKLLDQ
jgi:hypothetical protein